SAERSRGRGLPVPPTIGCGMSGSQESGRAGTGAAGDLRPTFVRDQVQEGFSRVPRGEVLHWGVAP
ncbi:MAG: hypothetical protein ACREN4_05475, partial [Candidatus Dormibacteria bacterium]